MKLSERSLKAKEKFADSNMSVASSIASAVFIGVLVFPLTAFISAMALGNEPFALMKMITLKQLFIFGGLYFSPLFAAWYAKEIAMDLYDQIEKATSNNFIGRTRNRKKLCFKY
ncbi:hypothetical protein [Methylomonas methanica]|uniref:Uncharacterized protein n=1 Tax=Methylomonas methanica TaxID=421 RepID=A0A177MY29_METMH|nr:hypothetical protein [Methylomonas methanica]OAI10552.1 hypothetical protein A1332_23720 [Methylomonas methanica]